MSGDKNSDSIRRLSALILTFAPDFTMSADEMQRAISTRGLDGFVQDTGGHIAALAETIKLLDRPQRGGAARGNG